MSLEDHPLGRFSLRLYGRSAVRDACLALQDEHHFDVNIVLACLWRAEHGDALDVETLRLLVSSTAAERELAAGLRALRRRCRGDADLHPALQGLELQAETLVQQRLFERLASRPSADEAPRTAATRALEGYARSSADPSSSRTLRAALVAEAFGS